ncbi:MAG: DUF1573 domain-containing protein [Bernardetiaceae bacterium]|nr:DUF1573 domain-containing protein [Bernardetiaceae bacterium]
MNNTIRFLIFLAVLIFISTTMALAQADIHFEEDRYEFGEVKEGQKVKRTFTYKNTGNAPLILSDLRTTCGCTVSEWDKNPLPPGEQNKITVVFDTKGKVGRQHKTVSVLSNSAQNPVAKLRLYGNVLPKE